MKWISYLMLLVMCACTSAKKHAGSLPKDFDFEGHRGTRGLMPENTIPAMYRGIDEGATTLEMDVLITKDKKVIVSHDPYFNDLITTTPEGTFLTKAESRKRLLYNLTYDSIRKYDVGMKPHPDFPQQQRIHVVKPLLTDLIDSVEMYADKKGKKIRYNIEIKSRASTDGINHPEIPEFVSLLMNVLKQKNVIDHTIIQSFDQRPLIYLHKNYPVVQTSLLLEASVKSSVDELISQLGYIPTAISPNQALVTKKFVEDCHSHHIKVIPWTVNTVTEMKNLVEFGVDGIISDYPNLFKQL